MEASVAAGQGQQQGGEAAAAAAGEGAAPGADLSQLEGVLSGLADGQEALRQQLGQLGQVIPTLGAPAAETTPAETAPEVDLSFLSDPTLDEAGIAERFQQAMSEAAQSHAERLLEARLGPLEARLDDNARESHAERLVQEFPEMGDPEVARPVVEVSRQLAEANGWPDQIAGDPRFWRIVFMAGRAAEAAQQEGADAPGVAHLEGGGGATPAPNQQDPGDAIVGAPRRGSSVLPL